VSGVMKFKFGDVSYHHNSKPFAFKIEYFVDNTADQTDTTDTEKDSTIDTSRMRPLFSLVSAPFYVYARKPSANSKHSANDTVLRKRAKRCNEFIQLPKCKVAKLNGSENPFYATAAINTMTTCKPNGQEISKNCTRTGKPMGKFTKMVEQLQRLVCNLTEEDKAVALGLIYKKIVPSLANQQSKTSSCAAQQLQPQPIVVTSPKYMSINNDTWDSMNLDTLPVSEPINYADYFASASSNPAMLLSSGSSTPTFSSTMPLLSKNRNNNNLLDLNVDSVFGYEYIPDF